jgi:hypothetical protein
VCVCVCVCVVFSEEELIPAFLLLWLPASSSSTHSEIFTSRFFVVFPTLCVIFLLVFRLGCTVTGQGSGKSRIVARCGCATYVSRGNIVVYLYRMPNSTAVRRSSFWGSAMLLILVLATCVDPSLAMQGPMRTRSIGGQQPGSLSLNRRPGLQIPSLSTQTN